MRTTNGAGLALRAAVLLASLALTADSNKTNE